MPADDPFAQSHERLDKLEEQIRRIRSGSPLGAEHEREGEALHAEAQNLRKKLTEAHGTSWDDIKHELHREWEALIHSTDRWAARVDSRFGKR